MGGFTALNFSPPASIMCFILCYSPCQLIYIPGTKNWPSCPWAYCTIAPPAVVAFVIVRVWRPCTVSPWLAIWIAPAGITANKINSISSPFHLLNLMAAYLDSVHELSPSLHFHLQVQKTLLLGARQSSHTLYRSRQQWMVLKICSSHCPSMPYLQVAASFNAYCYSTMLTH